ncbi:zinc-binding dehydrogenase [Streptomyces sp. NBC_01261]|uniref:zinc-binding dehydrogenase n=1 Tax=Streptomyces sp. NBC_01261 TaxID=2903802 RepID=UPI002E3066E4|nr:zinc-binding dehydrogenase [Streptomyces sp. NBC_01261]
MAIQVAKRLGAGRVVGAGRDRARLATLPGLGADATVALTDDAEATAAALAETAAEVDPVVDCLWGRPAGDAIMALLRARAGRSRALNWIQIGSMADPTIELPSVAMRSANFRLQGNGQGVVSTRPYLAVLPSLIEEIDGGTIAVTARTMPLAEVGTAWTEPEVPGVRTLLTP